MTITARFPGRCWTCNGPIAKGEEIEWSKGSPTKHIACAGTSAAQAAKPATQALSGRTGGVQVPRGRNRRPGSCERCGDYLAVGEGRLEFCEYDTGCTKHMDESGYHLTCADGGCETRRAEAKAAAETARKAKIETALVALRNLPEPIRISYHDGEYLSAYQAFGESAKLLESLGLAHYVSGWGSKVEDKLIQALGTDFTGTQVADYIVPPIGGGSQAWTRREIMARAHEIARTCEGDYAARMALGLRQAWQGARMALAA